MLDKEPVGTLLAFSLAHPVQDPAAVQLLALEGQVKLAFSISAIRILAVPIAAIPNHHGAAAVLPLRNGPFEVAVIQRIVLDLDREPLVRRIEGRALCNCPGFENTVKLEPKVVMQMRSRMLLDDKAEALRGTDLCISAGFGGFRKIPLGAVSCKQLFDHANTVKIRSHGTESSSLR